MVQKRALMIGLNYPGTSHALNGCINDVEMLKDILVQRFRFPEQNITLLLDTEGTEKPTLEAILRHLKQKVGECQPNDVLFLHYSGHGTQIADDEREELDGKDEALVTADGAPLRDDMLQEIFSQLPPNVKFTFIADCCHSGSMLDQPVQQVSGEKNTSVAAAPAGARDFKHRGLSLTDYKSLASELSRGFGGLNPQSLGDLLGGDAGKLLGGAVAQVLGGHSSNVPIQSFLGFLQNNKRPPKPAASPANLETAVLISGCQDQETSADAFINGQYNGALTSALIHVLTACPGNISNKDVCTRIRQHLKQSGYAQNPCLSCSNSQVNQAFVCNV